MHDNPAISDLDLAAAYQAGDRSAAEAIVRRHEGIVRATVSGVRFPASIERDDLLQTGRMALLGAAACKTFDPAKSQWTTFAMTVVRRAVWKEVAKLVSQQRGSGFEDWSGVVDPRSDAFDADLPEGRMRDVVNDVAFGDMDPDVAAEIYGLSGSAVRQLLTHVHSAMEDSPCR